MATKKGLGFTLGPIIPASDVKLKSTAGRESKYAAVIVQLQKLSVGQAVRIAGVSEDDREKLNGVASIASRKLADIRISVRRREPSGFVFLAVDKKKKP